MTTSEENKSTETRVANFLPESYKNHETKMVELDLGVRIVAARVDVNGSVPVRITFITYDCI